ncbi:phospholipase D-like domain-containing protein [Uliginosibacterium gangwonense]|uniref:phospholipase D-like domain-containing protein n=1 Tax=Uliginosibacterium gangwonense TaxID=392736 RepID=UPI000378ABC7|nr:phospholipase D-like domain-containing protein [Uliginosibacterium gangwonense]
MAGTEQLDTHRNVTVHADKQGLSAKSGVQWLLEKSKYPIAEISSDNEINVFVCGQQGFASIYEDIMAAKTSVDLVCWGFDPGMPLIRDGGPWRKEHTYGELLKAKAAEGVTIRLLVWFTEAGSAKQQSLLGYSSGSYIVPWLYTPGLETAKKNETLSIKQQRSNYCFHWWNEVLSKLHHGIEVKYREGNSKAVKQSLAEHEDATDSSTSQYVSWIDSEQSLLEGYATHHQKPIIIDWGEKDEQGDYAVGYIMGLNSISDFWDTAAHLFDDPKREPDWEGSSHTSLMIGNTPLSREPYRDYAARLRGSVLKGVHDNFEFGWNSKDTKTLTPRKSYKALKEALPPPLKAEPKKPFKANPKHPCQLQVLRTHPEADLDKSIKAAYLHATRQAQDYIYIEQQYFFYEIWAREFQNNRKDFTAGIQNAGWDKAQHPILHLFVVLPWPEDPGMVPRTYDTLKMLGHANSMPQQDQRLNTENQTYHQDEAALKESQSYDTGTPITPRRSSLAQDADNLPAAQTDKNGVLYLVDDKQKDKVGQTLGVKALFCRMVTYNSTGIKGVSYRGTDINKDQIAANDNLKKAADVVKETDVMYRQIYIHSKLMITDDQWFTLGSANLNQRSMAVDSELNVGCAHPATAQDLRQEVWGMMTGWDIDATGGTGGQEAIATAFKQWKAISTQNGQKMDHKHPPASGFIVPFVDNRKSTFRHG